MAPSPLAACTVSENRRLKGLARGVPGTPRARRLASSRRPTSAVYTPRRHNTVLHSIVREHYANFLAHTTANYAAPLPRYVTNAFERNIVCGDFSQASSASLRRVRPRRPRRLFVQS
jgi:hypothetical protein